MRYMQPDVHLVNTIKRMRTGKYLLVIVRTGAAGKVFVFLFPGLTAVGGAPEAAVAIRQFYGRVDDFGVLRRYCQAGLAASLLRQSRSELAPGFTAVFGFVNTTAWPTVHQYGDIAQALPTDSIEHIRIARVHVDFGDAGVLVIDVCIAQTVAQNLAPVLAAVGRLVEAAVAAARPERTLSRHVHRI